MITQKMDSMILQVLRHRLTRHADADHNIITNIIFVLVSSFPICHYLLYFYIVLVYLFIISLFT